MALSDSYLIRWYGPFSCKEDLKDWEEKHHPVRFNLYAFQAKQKGKKDKYYCGMAFRQTVGTRLRNHDHHIHDFENSKTERLLIWIGTIANKKAKESDVRICENLLTSSLASIGVGERNLENRTNKKPPVNNAYIINEWWKINEEEIKKKERGSVPAVIPEVMAYYSETKALYGSNKLKHIGDL
ncbi:MAG: hypothetical protein IJ550_01985 [Bacteroidaceae bacterium]|nr:hypothetical protein [Bacteroidaceae bacterium]MDY6257969.1 hypothetical protein [Bacteroidaceae bacterium]